MRYINLHFTYLLTYSRCSTGKHAEPTKRNLGLGPFYLAAVGTIVMVPSCRRNMHSPLFTGFDCHYRSEDVASHDVPGTFFEVSSFLAMQMLM